MNLEALRSEISAARARFEAFRGEPSSLDAVLQELGITLEELQVASEELTSQSDRLSTLQEKASAIARRQQSRFDLAPLAYLVTDLDGMIREANRAAESLFGRSPAALAKMPIVALASAPERFPLRARIVQLQGEPGLGARHWDLWLRHPLRGPFEATVWVSRAQDPTGRGGELLWMVLPRATLPPPSAAGQLPLVLAETAEDLDEANRIAERLESDLGRSEAAVADLRRAHAQAEVATAEKVRLLGALAHEIRNPMNALLGAVALVRETDLSEEQGEFVEMIERSGARVVEIIRGVLDLARMQSGHFETTSDELDLVDVVEGTVRSACAGPSARGVEVGCRIAPDVPRRVVGDPHALGQILENLLGNALKFTEEGDVTVTVSREPEAGARNLVRLEVADTGPGIEPERLATIFEPFGPGGLARQRHGGTGLGLSITKEIVERLGGSLRIESALGRGSCFTAILPLPPAAAQPPPLHPIAERPRILVGDGDRASREGLAEILRSWNADVVEAGDAESVIAHLAREDGEIALLVLDVRLAGRSDFALLERLRESNHALAKTLVVLPVRHRHGDVTRLHELGVNAWILKPIRRDELHERVTTMLEPASS